MKRIITLIFFYILITLIIHNCGKNDSPTLQNSYLGQTPPGLTPEIFAPGIVTKGEDESLIVISPDGKEIFYTTKLGPQKRHTIMVSKLEERNWTKPKIASFSGQYYDAISSISPDGNYLYFNSMRPQKLGDPLFDVQNIWVLKRRGNDWINPTMLPFPINSSARELGGFLSKDGYFYFTTTREGIRGRCRSKFVDGEYSSPENIQDHYNFDIPCFEIVSDPNEKLLVFVSYDQEDGFGKFDLYVSFKKGEDEWTKPKNMGDRINTSANEHFPTFSPDGQYMFFVSDRISDKFKSKDNLTLEQIKEMKNSPQNGSSDIYWVDAKIIESMIPLELK